MASLTSTTLNNIENMDQCTKEAIKKKVQALLDGDL